VALGAIVVAGGAILLYVPVISQDLAPISAVPGPPAYDLGRIDGTSPTGYVYVAVRWTATAGVLVIGGACSGTCTSYSELSGITVQRGTSGSFTIDQPIGGEFFIGANTTSESTAVVSVEITSTFSTLATILVPIGVVVGLAGVLLGRKGAAPMTSRPAPASAGTTDEDGPISEGSQNFPEPPANP